MKNYGPLSQMETFFTLNMYFVVSFIIDKIYISLIVFIDKIYISLIVFTRVALLNKHITRLRLVLVPPSIEMLGRVLV